MDRDEDSDGMATKRKRPWGWMLAGVFALTASSGALAGAALSTTVQDMHGQHGAGDSAAMDKHVDEMIERILSDGTPEQKARFKTAIGTVHAELGATHAQMGKAHELLLELLTRPQIDRGALETLRVEQMRQMDTVSKRLADSLADAAEILTPVQRARFAEQIKHK
jgi:Spy/CpxP family protein refolding chaperone